MGVLNTELGNVPGAAGGGGWPPIAFFGNMNATPQNAVAGCGYAHKSPVTGFLTFPASPADGDEVAVYRICGSPAGPVNLCFQSKQFQDNNCANLQSGVAPDSYAYATLWKFSAVADAWVPSSDASIII